jgi:hypothetical protein
MTGIRNDPRVGLVERQAFRALYRVRPPCTQVRCREQCPLPSRQRGDSIQGLNEKLPCTVHTASQRALVGSWSHTMCMCECENCCVISNTPIRE